MRALPFDESPQTLLSLIIKEFDVKEIGCILIMLYSIPHGEVFEIREQIFFCPVSLGKRIWYFVVYGEIVCVCFNPLLPIKPSSLTVSGLPVFGHPAIVSF